MPWRGRSTYSVRTRQAAQVLTSRRATETLMPPRRKRPRPTYRVSFSSTLICTGCGKTTTVSGEDKIMATVPEDLPPGWVCDAGPS